MGRRKYKHVRQYDFKGGINTELENARPNQVSDARNVWTPEGRLVQRPGYRRFRQVTPESTNSPSITHKFYDDSAGTFSDLTLTPIANQTWLSGDLWYMGFDSQSDVENLFTINIALTPAGATAGNVTIGTTATLQAWDGSAWVTIDSDGEKESDSTPTWVNTLFTIDRDRPIISAQSTIDGESKYWVRFATGQLVSFDANGSNVTVTATAYDPDVMDVVGLHEVQFDTGLKSITLTSDQTLRAHVHDGLQDSNNEVITTLSGPAILDEPSMLAAVPQFREAYVTYNYNVYNLTHEGTVSNAAIETDPFLIGGTDETDDFAPYADDAVEKLNAFPRCKYIIYHDDRLFCINLEDAQYTIRWSAASPGYKVFPVSNFTNLVEDDQSPITGAAVLNETVTVFKQDSIWQLQAIGEDDIGQTQYQPVKVVGGIGCVSNASISLTPQGLVFLAEDGVYLFNGTPQVQKLSDRLDNYFLRITPGRRPFAVSAHWQRQNCYVLSTSIDGSEVNNIVFVWDYKHNAWWLWTGMNALSFATTEDVFDTQFLTFGNNNGELFRFVDGHFYDVLSAPTVYVDLHRRGYGDFSTKRFSEVRVTSSNKNTALKAKLKVYDDEGSAVTETFTLTDDNEAKYGTAVFGTATFASYQRRHRRQRYRLTGEWCNVRISNETAGMPLELDEVSVGFMPLGNR